MQTIALSLILLGLLSMINTQVNLEEKGIFFIPEDYEGDFTVQGVTVGQEFSIQLHANLENRRNWYLLNGADLRNTSPSNVDKTNTGKYTPIPHAINEKGLGGTTEFTFLCKEPGEEKISFEYRNPLDEQSEKVQDVIVRVDSIEDDIEEDDEEAQAEIDQPAEEPEELNSSEITKQDSVSSENSSEVNQGTENKPEDSDEDS